MIHDYELILLDFDGLLVDTERYHFAAYSELCRKRGFELTWDFSHFCVEAHGKAGGVWDGLAREFPQIFIDEPRKEVLYDEKKQIYIDILKNSELEFMEGAAEFLEMINAMGKKHAVVTNSPRAHIDVIKESLPLLKTIPLWVTREDYAQPKPSPEGYLKAMATLGEGRAIGFEDTLKGLKALLAAGVDGVLVCPADHKHVPEGVSLGARHFTSLQYFTATKNSP